MKNTEFVRLARFLNYRRSFLSPVSAVVRIPTLPYEAFENKGANVRLWALARAFDSARVFSFAEGQFLDFPDRSFLDVNEVISNHYIFIARANICIEKQFHLLDAPKFPLYVRTTLQALGKSSKSLLYELFHDGTDALYATCEITDVLVSKATRKPVQYPDWWLRKYSGLISGSMDTPPEVKDPPMQTYSSSVIVRNSDLDDYFHANWAISVQYSCDNIFEGISSNAFPNLNKQVWYSGFQSADMLFKAEANFSDKLKVESWENAKRKDSTCTRILNGQNLCFYANFTFYNDSQN